MKMMVLLLIMNKAATSAQECCGIVRAYVSQKAAQHICDKASVKGASNLTCLSFCEWVNKQLLPNEVLEPGFPQRLSVETGRKWMHEMGFEVQAVKKGSYSTALMQRRTRTALFVDSTGLLERSVFAILEKITRVANDTLSRSFCEYRFLNRLRLAMANHFAMVAPLPFY